MAKNDIFKWVISIYSSSASRWGRIEHEYAPIVVSTVNFSLNEYLRASIHIWQINSIQIPLSKYLQTRCLLVLSMLILKKNVHSGIDLE